MPRLKEETCRPGAKLKNMFSSWEARLVKHFINSFRVVTWNGREPYIDRSDPFGEYTIYIPRSSGGAFPWDKFRFGYALSLTDDAEPQTICTISAGTIRVHGAGNFAFAGGDVTLSPMTVAWVYASMPRGGGTVTIGTQSTEPVTDVTTLRVPLFKFEFVGGSYVIPDGGICNLGDINFDVPLL